MAGQAITIVQSGASTLQTVLQYVVPVVVAALTFWATRRTQRSGEAERRTAEKEDWRREQALRGTTAFNDALHVWELQIGTFKTNKRTDQPLTPSVLECASAREEAVRALYGLTLLAEGSIVDSGFLLQAEVGRLFMEIDAHGPDSAEVSAREVSVRRAKKAFYDASRAELGLPPLPAIIFHESVDGALPATPTPPGPARATEPEPGG